jgi:hypothetical protein
MVHCGDWGTAYESAAVLMQDMSQAVYSMEGLTKLLAANKNKEVTDILAQMDMVRSVFTHGGHRQEDTFERKETPMAASKDMMDKQTSAWRRCNMPITLLMGRSPGGSTLRVRAIGRSFTTRSAICSARSCVLR